MDTIDYKKYMQLTNDEKKDEAEHYKSGFIPDSVYRFFPLQTDKDNLILETLSEGKVHLSLFKDLNDPFDGDAWYISRELSSKGLDVDKLHKQLLEMRSEMRICCFTENDNNNMPMWAYYANSHKGFCVEYCIDEKMKKYMFPISYVDYKLCFDMKKLLNIWGETTASPIQRRQMHEVFLSNVVKHKSWYMEKEIRLIEFKEYFTMQPYNIYVGKDCSDSQRDILVQIAHKLGCNVFRMENDNESTRFALKASRL